MLRVEMLPASNGDCLWIEYGSDTEVHRMLIDGGRKRSYPHLRARILALPPKERVFELLIVTHIDNDHIEGVLALLQDAPLNCRFKEIWYNGWRHLDQPPATAPPEDVLGPKEGEFLGVLLEDNQLPWNTAFDGGPVVVPERGDLPQWRLEGELILTILSPTTKQLTALRQQWRKVIQDAGFQPGNINTMRNLLKQRRYSPINDALGSVQDGPGGGDNSAANGSSIAVLAEYDGARALLTGDAFAGVLEASLARAHFSADEPLVADVWKLSHHGSWDNFTRNLFALVRSSRYLVSTDGSRHYHPHAKTLDYIIENYQGNGRPELVFNYRTPYTEPWTQSSRCKKPFRSTYPAGSVVML